MFKSLFNAILSANERKIGVPLDYARQIANADTRLFMRFGKIFSFLDPRQQLPADAYHAARITSVLVADCGSCVEAELNLARIAGLDDDLIRQILSEDLDSLSDGLTAVIELSLAVARHQDAPEARYKVKEHYGEKGLIELAYAINGAAMLPGIKRTMGYATSCNLELIRSANDGTKNGKSKINSGRSKQ